MNNIFESIILDIIYLQVIGRPIFIGGRGHCYNTDDTLM